MMLKERLMPEGKHWKCEVLVIGAGPAGSTAARFAARNGVSVILLERRERVGLPVRCAEYVPLPVSRYVDLNLPGLMVQGVKAMRTYIPGEPVKEAIVPGAIINRDRLDQALADLAVEAGTCLKIGFQAFSRSEDQVFALGLAGPATISCRIIIGADGPSSQVSRWMKNSPNVHLNGVQYRVPLIKTLDHTRIYFRPYLKGGYGWLFPKKNLANVGIGLDSSSEQGPKIVLEEFRKELIEEGLIGQEILGIVGGLVPVGGLTGLVKQNMILAGDAAGTCHPITGAGVGNALISGEMAGLAAAEAVLKGCLQPLQEYERNLIDLLGHSLHHGVRKRKTMMEQWSEKGFSKTIQAHWVGFNGYYR
jgi:digeranylgeranylglycerophospholipid reductase